MSDLNRYACTGRLTRDPTLRAPQPDRPVLSFSLAVNDLPRSTAAGVREERANFFDFVIFGRQAEALSPILRKGMKVSVDGRLRHQVWEAEGQRRSRVEVVVDHLDILTPKGERQEPADAIDDGVGF